MVATAHVWCVGAGGGQEASPCSRNEQPFLQEEATEDTVTALLALASPSIVKPRTALLRSWGRTKDFSHPKPAAELTVLPHSLPAGRAPSVCTVERGMVLLKRDAHHCELHWNPWRGKKIKKKKKKSSCADTVLAFQYWVKTPKFCVKVWPLLFFSNKSKFWIKIILSKDLHVFF